MSFPSFALTDEEALQIALAVSKANERERSARRHSRFVAGLGEATDSDEAVALVLAREQEREMEQSLGGVPDRSSRGRPPQRLPPGRARRLGASPHAVLRHLPDHPDQDVVRGQDGVDVDRMSYEELLALGERIGRANPESRREKASRLLARLPTSKFVKKDGMQDQDMQCNICYNKFKDGESLRTLPCLHAFHCECIDKWLTGDMPGASSCPVCQHAVDA